MRYERYERGQKSNMFFVISMSVLAASMEEPAVIDGSEAVAKSYPDFFRDLERTGAKTE